MVKYAIYVRKSTEGEDRQVQSIGAQLHELRIIAEKQNLKVVRVYQEAKSAKAPFKRPELTSMLESAKRGEINGILCWQINRLSRNPAESGIIQQMLQDGVLKIIRTADRVYTPEDNAVLLGVESSISSQFIIDLRKNVKRGMREKIRNGGLPGQAPEGYMNNRLEKTIEVDPLRFPMIRKLFDMYLTGHHTVSEIKRFLDDAGYLTTRRRHSGNVPISRNTIYNILSNPRYAGIIPDPHEDGVTYKANFPAMITREEFSEVQRLLGVRGRSRYITKQEFELRGLIKCGECGCNITAERKQKKLKDGRINYYTYYHCTHKRPCSQRGCIREVDLFSQLDSLINKYTISPQLYDWGIRAINEIAHEESKQRNKVQVMQNRSIESIQSKLDRLLDLVADGVITADEYKEKVASLKNELKVRQDEQHATADRVKNWYEIVGSTLEMLTEAPEKFARGSFGERRDILLAIGKNPVLTNNILSITPNEWLIPLEKELPKINDKLDKVITGLDKIENDEKSTIMSTWYTRQDSNLRPLGSKPSILIR